MNSTSDISGVTYDIVIATRNRPDALALSLPLMICQSRPANRIIIVDASDDPEPVRAAVQQATYGWTGEVLLLPSAPGLPHQRNKGLREVTAPIVFFLDDDSLLYDDTAAEILRLYERDADGSISGVAAAEAFVPPVTLPSTTYQMTQRHRREAKTRWIRNWFERHLTALKPALYLGQVLNARHNQTDWLTACDAKPVEYMTGFRMTFRTEAILTDGFDETFGGYALDEDIDASFTAMKTGLVVGARRARIYHHRRPGGRGSSFEAGRMSIFNRAYVLAKHASPPHGSTSLRRAVQWRNSIFVALKLASLLPGVFRPATRRTLFGVLAGLREARRQVWSLERTQHAAKTLQSQGNLPI